MSYVIAVAAPPGGGKSSLLSALATRLGDVATIHFDDYETATSQPPSEILRQLRAGSVPDGVAAPRLADDLADLKRGGAATMPDGRETGPAKYVLFEMPFGRGHAPTSDLIDYVLWIDVPPDLALVRKLREYLALAADDPRPEGPREFVAWLDGYLESYLGSVRDMLEIQRDWIADGADMTIDGDMEPDAAAAQAVQEIRARFP